MSAMTAPIGRRRTSAAICSGVGRWARGGLRGVGGLGRASGGWRTALGGSAWRRGRGVRTGGAANQPGFECLGTERAAGDAREDFRNVAGAKRMRVVAERGGEVSAVVDELPDEGEEAAEAVGFGGARWRTCGLSEQRARVRVKDFFPYHSFRKAHSRE